MQMKLLGITTVHYDVTGQRLIIFSVCQTLENTWEYNGTVRHLFTNFKKACVSAMRKVLYSILT
jgi:hypothetical protein